MISYGIGSGFGMIFSNEISTEFGMGLTSEELRLSHMTCIEHCCRTPNSRCTKTAVRTKQLLPEHEHEQNSLRSCVLRARPRTKQLFAEHEQNTELEHNT